MADSDVWCQNNALSSMQIKHILIILDIHSSFAVCLSRILKGILSVMYCQTLTPTPGVNPLTSVAAERQVTQSENYKGYKGKENFFQALETKLALTGTHWNFPFSRDLCGLRTREGAEPDAHVLRLEQELGLSLLPPRHRVLASCDKSTGFPWWWRCPGFAWAIPLAVVIAMVLDKCIVTEPSLAVLQQFLRASMNFSFFFDAAWLCDQHVYGKQVSIVS